MAPKGVKGVQGKFAKAKAKAAMNKKPAAAPPIRQRPSAADVSELEGPVPTPADRRKFMQIVKAGGAHQAILDDIRNIQDLGYGKNKMSRLNKKISAWVEQGFDHPTFQDTIQYSESKKRAERNKAMPWSILKAKLFHNCEEAAIAALEEGDVVAVTNPKDPDGKPWYRYDDIIVEHGKDMRRSRGLTVAGNVSGDVSGFLLNMESFFESIEDGYDLSITDPHVSKKTAAITDCLPGADDDPMTTALKKVKIASGNLSKLRLKVLECTGSTHGSKHDAFVKAHLSDKESVIQAILAKYDTLLRTKSLPGATSATTPALIKQAIAIDSKLCQQIASAIQVAKTMEE
ncbi:unnamed protein product [Prorocentrum cordatum]|uniref:Uncharacterized protein n=2 Tax=Prorocentrum cordatum TaxID=2364126 RepID=A0ABN9QHV3_9DINO|nr:unnamed protein product [Polarella glacialis]